ncbi:T9SS type A sorting domain-containing protein [Ferruginibacter lapsinanis]|uniref:T9SS type A sorting domain-containing protein n=1 Tax=Ferruginibacter lapsinanis TaxID=563172 RepID=UPI001E40159F|nr:T9SS type A sorting domain-containing protein [Ferruginibacter lapsinanis]UEG49611.1 T9SS type A sorting domain-containing protein [Ferruginibacter lapsinanis]
MKKIFYYLFFTACFFSLQAHAQQQIFDFASATSGGSPSGYTKTGVGTYYKGTTGGTITDGSANCDTYTPSKATSSSLFIFVAVNDITKITVRGTGTGSNRTFSALATSSTLAGTYTADAGAAGVGTINGSTCGSIAVTPSATITAGTYIRITFSGNLNVTSLLIDANIGVAPTVTTNASVATSITSSTATLGGQLTDAGSTAVTVSGFCYGLTANPTTADSKTTDGPTAVGAITSNISGLAFSTTYHVRAYATNSAGTSYGADQTFTTSAPSSPTAIASPASLNFGTILTNTTSAEKTFTVVAGGLSPANGNITITPPSGYQVSLTSGSGFASSVTIPYTGGAFASTTVYVNFTPTAVIAYNGNITVTGGGITTQNVAVIGAGTDVAFEIGDYKSVATGNWGTNATWNKWDGTNWVASADFPNATTANVYITDGFTVNAETSGRSVKNLYVNGSSTLKSSNLVNSPLYLKIYGTTFDVQPGSLVGNVATGNNADGLSLDIFSTGLTVSGGGTINLSRMRTNTASTTVTINTNVVLNYHGSGNAGNAAGYYTVAGDNNTLTINAGKTLTFAPWSCYTPISSSHTNGTFNQVINVNGTLTFIDGLAPGNATANGWAGHTNGYFSFGAAAGKTFVLNIGSTGTMNVSEFYPNGTKADNTPGTGDPVTINIAAGGVLNVSKIADFRNATQTVTGAGTFTLAIGAKLRIGSVDGITASAAAGPIQTTTRNFSGGAVYAYEGIAAQVTGSGLPSTIGGLIINNATGVTASNSVLILDSLNLTNGLLNVTSSEMPTLAEVGIVNGGSTASHVNGPMGKLTVSTASFSFPVGKGGVYHPATIIPAANTSSSYTAEYFNTSGASTTSVLSPLISVSTSEYWNIARNSGADAQVSLGYDNTKTTTWSNGGTPDAAHDICVAHLGASWADETGTTGTDMFGNLATGTVTSQALSSFSPFTFGLKLTDVTPVILKSFNATLVNGQTKLIWYTTNEINIAGYTIERSTDGANFTNAGLVNAANLESNSYTFTDAAITSGVTYYRIRITDKAGMIKYSSIIAVNNKKADQLNVFPNPVVNNLYVSHKKATDGATLKVYAMDGRQMKAVVITKNAVQSTINASSLAKGTYKLVFTNGEDVQYIKFVKQ